MALISLSTNDVFTFKYKKSNNFWDRTGDWKINPLFKPKKEDTYLVIFGGVNSYGKENAADQLALLEKHFSVLYKSPLAVNTNPGHGTEPRNMLVVFETKENVQAL